MKNTLKLAGALLLALTVSSVGLANPIITGGVTFLGIGTMDSSLAASTTLLTASASVGSSSGTFLTNGVVFGNAVAITTPWTFNSGAHASLWSVGGFTFDLTSSSIVTQNSTFLNVVGSGVINHTGYDATSGTWSFTVPGDDASGTFTFAAASHGVPEGGSTALLVGLSLVSLSLITLRRKRKSA